jgi:hypothetical protein
MYFFYWEKRVDFLGFEKFLNYGNYFGFDGMRNVFKLMEKLAIAFRSKRFL